KLRSSGCTILSLSGPTTPSSFAVGTTSRKSRIWWASSRRVYSEQNLPNEMKRIMGIDYGSARIGVALSDELQMLAHPTETIVIAKVADPVARIATLVSEKNVAQIVV